MLSMPKYHSTLIFFNKFIILKCPVHCSACSEYDICKSCPDITCKMDSAWDVILHAKLAQMER